MGKKLAVLIFVVLGYFSAKAQYFQTGQDPSYIHWRQINTSNFQVIYPQEFENQAQKIVFILEKVYNNASYSLNYNPRKVSVILHTHTANSNGLLAWAPKRIELFTTPNQQIYAQDWAEQLALHEFRHLVQMDKIQSELPLLLTTIFGEQAAAIVTGAYLPLWFLEGDAVVTETTLSNSGRGRTASFSMEYRAQLLEKEKYTFDKAYLGSFKSFVPDHYKLGYWMVGKSRELYGIELWDKVLQQIGRKPLSLSPMNSILKQTTGSNSKQLYLQVFDSLKNEWSRELHARVIDSISIISPTNKTYTRYLYPKINSDSSIFAYRTSIGDVGRFVLVKAGKKDHVFYTPGPILDNMVSKTDNLIIWSEWRPGLRWSHSDKSVINIYNTDTKQVIEIKSENKLFSPVITSDKKFFAAVETDLQNNFFLSVFDLETGKVIKRFQTPDNQYFISPTWDREGEKLFVVCLSEKGKYLASFDLKKHEIERLSDNTFANLKNPVYANGQLIFSSDFSGSDNLYSLDINTKKIKQIASVPFGANYPDISADGKMLYFSNYNSSGYQIAAMQLSENTNARIVNSIQLQSNPLADNLASQEQGIPNLTNSDTIVYNSTKYSKIGHLFNFHSWAPAYIDIDNQEIRPGFSLFSQNKLGTAETKLGYDYNISDRTGKYKLIFNYLGWFPEISANFSFGSEASNYYHITNRINEKKEVVGRDTTINRLSWNEFTTELKIRLPLNISKGKYSSMFLPEVSFSNVSVSKPNQELKNIYPAGYNAFTYLLHYYKLLRTSNQSLMPKWGYQINAVYRHTPFDAIGLGTLYGAQAILYAPAFAVNDGFRLYQGFQNKEFTRNSYSFANFVHSPRGFQSYLNNKMYSMSVDYKFTIGYPDFSIGKLAYVKRIKASLFYDYAWLSMPTRDKEGKIHANSINMNMRSLGLELTSDFHAFRFFAPIEIGVRPIYRPANKSMQFDFLLSINFNGF